jgi:hypothetical protein
MSYVRRGPGCTESQYMRTITREDFKRVTAEAQLSGEGSQKLDDENNAFAILAASGDGGDIHFQC